MTERQTAADIAAILRRQIEAGTYPTGSQLPSVRKLMATFGAASATVDRAMEILETEGLLHPRHGSGNFVRKGRRIRRNLIEDLRLEYQRSLTGDDSEGLFEAMTGEEADVTPGHRFLDADDALAAALAVDPGTRLLERSFIYKVDGVPFQTARFYMTANLAARAGLPDAERKGLGSLAHLRAAGVTVERATITIIIRRATVEEAATLAIPAGTSAVERSRIVFGDGHPVEVSTAVVGADHIEFFLDVPLRGETR